MRNPSSWHLGHPNQRRILWMLALMLLGVVALGVKEAYRYRVIADHQQLMTAEQAHLDMIQAFRVEMDSARLGFERLHFPITGHFGTDDASQAGDGAHEHQAFHAQGEIARFFGQDLPQGGEENGRAGLQGRRQQGDDEFHAQPLLRRQAALRVASHADDADAVLRQRFGHGQADPRGGAGHHDAPVPARTIHAAHLPVLVKG